MPSSHRAHAEWTPTRLIRWAETVGPETGKLVSRILESRPHPEQGYRACLRIIEQGRRYGNIRLEAACARALALDSWRYHTVKNILTAGQDRLPIEAAALSFEERLGLLVDTEWTAREQRKLQRHLHTAKLRYPASLEAVDFTHPRRLIRQQVLTLGSCTWVAERHNLILVGPTGIGKSFLCCAFVERACRRGFTARYVRMPRVLHELAVGRGDGSYARLLARLAKLDLLAIDDWMVAPLRDTERCDLTEVIEDRAERVSTLIASQLPVTDWHAVIGDPNQADAICDRLLHDAHRIEVKGAARCDGHTTRRANARRRPHEHATGNGQTATNPNPRTPATREGHSGSEPPVDRARASKTRARRAAELDRQRGRVSHTLWTAHAPPTRPTGTLVCTLEHEITSRILTIRGDTDRRELTEQRRYAPTGIPLRRNRCSRSPELPFHFTEISTPHALSGGPLVALGATRGSTTGSLVSQETRDNRP